MERVSPSFVPKVHPATRPVEADDPMTLQATPVEGDPEVMLRLIVQEYAWMGWNAEQIACLFRDPFYPALHGLGRLLGEAGIRERIARELGRCGVFHFEATVDDEADAADVEPDVVQIGSLAHLGSTHSPRDLTRVRAEAAGTATREGGTHAEGQ